MEPYDVMRIMIVVLTPIICWYFTRHQPGERVPLRKWAEEFHNKRYYLHAIGYVVIIRWKSITDKLNEPMKSRTGHWTDWVFGVSCLEGFEWVAWVSPIFVYLLLTKVSGIPILDRRALSKWGDDPGYQAYRERVPAIFPKLNL